VRGAIGPGKRDEGGFTMVEAVLVLVIMAVLAAVGVFVYTAYIDKANRLADRVDLGLLNRATQVYAAERMQSPAAVFPAASSDGEKMQLLVGERFLDQLLRPRQRGAAFLFNRNKGKWYLSNEDPDLLYYSDFDNADGMIVLNAGWAVAEGRLIHTITGESKIVFDSTWGKDYTISLRGTYLSGKSTQSGYGIYYRINTVSGVSGYCFQFDPGKGNLFTVRTVQHGGEKEEIQFVAMTDVMGPDFNIYVPHDINISVKGDRHTIAVDGVTVLDFTDSTFKEGYVGVRTWHDSRVELDNIIVRKQ